MLHTLNNLKINSNIRSKLILYFLLICLVFPSCNSIKYAKTKQYDSILKEMIIGSFESKRSSDGTIVFAKFTAEGNFENKYYSNSDIISIQNGTWDIKDSCIVWLTKNGNVHDTKKIKKHRRYPYKSKLKILRMSNNAITLKIDKHKKMTLFKILSEDIN